jgi:glutamate-1-semialdehyde aminotransferase
MEPEALRQQAARAVNLARAEGLVGGHPDPSVVEFPSPHGGTWLKLFADHRDAGCELAAVVVDSFGMMHDPDQREAVQRRADRLRPDGILLMQYHSLEAIVDQGQWTSLRHGHFAYYSLPALQRLLATVDLQVVRAWEFPLYGKTVVLAIAPTAAGRPVHQSVVDRVEHELAMGLTQSTSLRSLQRSADDDSVGLGSQLRSAAEAGLLVYGYGATSRAIGLLNRSGVTSAELIAIADASTAKQGRGLPRALDDGSGRIPIISPEELVAADPDRVLLLLPDLLPEVERALPQLAGRWVTDPAQLLMPSLTAQPRRSFERSNELQRRLHDLVPGGAHTYARGSDQYPDGMAPVLTHGSGARVWDVDGNEYVEYGMGLRSVTLGHGYGPVADAVAAAVARGTNFSRPTHLEAQAAEEFLDLVPFADMVKFGKNGSDTTTAAVKLARAATGRDVIAVADHPFFSVDDWFIGLTEMDAGIPHQIKALTDRFLYNDIASLQAVFDRHEGAVAAVIMEAATAVAEPVPGYLEAVRELCTQYGTVLIFDEIITGFRWSAGGAQAVYGVAPDLSCWGKALGNGFPISALAGRRELMELGGLRTDEPRTFLLSTTHGPETTGLAAMLATLAAYRTTDPVARMEAVGRRLAVGVAEISRAAGLSDHLGVSGRPSCLVYWTRDEARQSSQAYRTLLMSGLIENGVLGQSFVSSAAHTDDDVDLTLRAVESAVVDYRRAIERADVASVLRGRPVAPAVRRLAVPRREPDDPGSPRAQR